MRQAASRRITVRCGGPARTGSFAAKLQIVCEEIDESVMWLEVADATCKPLKPQIAPLLSEALELRAIFSKSRSTFRNRNS